MIYKLGLAQVQSGVFLYLYLFEYVVEVTNYGLYLTVEREHCRFIDGL